MVKLLFFYLLLVSSSFGFEDENCFKEDFSTIVKKGYGPFGLIEESLIVKKTKCEIEIELTKAKYLSKKWKIDICREPIHIKFGNNYQDVAKKVKPKCLAGDSIFCENVKSLNDVLEDNGLIYGTGQREDLKSEHGRVYCSYLLINQYLKKSIVFSPEKPLQIALDGVTFLQNLESVNKDKDLIIKKSVTNRPIDSTKDQSTETTLYDF